MLTNIIFHSLKKRIIYLFIYYAVTKNLATAGLVRINAKEIDKKEGQVRRDKKIRDWGTEDEILYTSLGNWCVKRGKRTEPKTEKEKKKETGSIPYWFL